MYEGDAEAAVVSWVDPGEGGPGAVVWVTADEMGSSCCRSSVVADWEGEAGENG